MKGIGSVINGLRRIVLLEDRVERNAEEMRRLVEASRDHEARIVRIETIIEMARGGPPRDRLPR